MQEQIISVEQNCLWQAKIVDAEEENIFANYKNLIKVIAMRISKLCRET